EERLVQEELRGGRARGVVAERGAHGALVAHAERGRAVRPLRLVARLAVAERAPGAAPVLLDVHAEAAREVLREQRGRGVRRARDDVRGELRQALELADLLERAAVVRDEDAARAERGKAGVRRRVGRLVDAGVQEHHLVGEVHRLQRSAVGVHLFQPEARSGQVEHARAERRAGPRGGQEEPLRGVGRVGRERRAVFIPGRTLGGTCKRTVPPGACPPSGSSSSTTRPSRSISDGWLETIERARWKSKSGGFTGAERSPPRKRWKCRARKKSIAGSGGAG